MKKVALIIGIVAVCIAVAVGIAVMLVRMLSDKPEIDGSAESETAETQISVTDLSEIVGSTQSLSEAKPYVYELAYANADDDFSRAFMGKTTMKINSINSETGMAQVEFCVPDLEKIMRANLPSDTSGDYDALLEKYFSDINAAIVGAGEGEMIVKTLECPVVTDAFGTKVSIEGAPILNYQNILAEALMEMLSEGEVTE